MHCECSRLFIWSCSWCGGTVNLRWWTLYELVGYRPRHCVGSTTIFVYYLLSLIVYGITFRQRNVSIREPKEGTSKGGLEILRSKWNCYIDNGLMVTMLFAFNLENSKTIWFISMCRQVAYRQEKKAFPCLLMSFRHAKKIVTIDETYSTYMTTDSYSLIKSLNYQTI